jgi:hypothetical protein
LTVPRKSDRVVPCHGKHGQTLPCALHHIMVRGINKSSIFKDDQDKNLFLERLGQNLIDGKCSVWKKGLWF